MLLCIILSSVDDLKICYIATLQKARTVFYLNFKSFQSQARHKFPFAFWSILQSKAEITDHLYSAAEEFFEQRWNFLFEDLTPS